MAYLRIVKKGGNYYLRREWREGGKKRSKVLARFGHERNVEMRPIVA